MAKVAIINDRTGGRADSLGLSMALAGHNVVMIPGNGGTERFGQSVAIMPPKSPDPYQFAEYQSAILVVLRREKVEFAIVDTESLLVLDMVGFLGTRNVPCFGPTYEIAALEGDKIGAKSLMDCEGISTAPWAGFFEYDRAVSYVNLHGRSVLPCVVKARGLAAGKGAELCFTMEKLLTTLREFMHDGKHGDAGRHVVIEDFLPGTERSAHVFCDGTHYYVVPFLFEDYKQALDGDRGDMTGSMGTLAPAQGMTRALMKTVEQKTIAPIFNHYQRTGAKPKGLLYPGLMVEKGLPRVLEYNWRPGDSECQVLVAKLRSDLYQLIKACVFGTLEQEIIEWYPDAVACVTKVSGGYPNSYKTGYEITGLREAERLPNVTINHAGTKRDGNKYYSDGGRILNFTARGRDMKEAIERALEAANMVDWTDAFNRTDFGKRPTR